jgi:DUF1365 family protein
MESALYFGFVRHRRFSPVAHSFRYATWMAWLDLSELDQAFEGRWLWSGRRPALAWVKRSDYLAPCNVPIDEAVRQRVEQATGRRPDGPVRMLTHLRTFGHCFNPVTFYYCFDARGERVETVLAEINNTPWNERHAYVLAADASGRVRARFAKDFHVSPFMPMALEYDWRFTAPGERLAIRMRNLQGDNRLFDATLALERRGISGATLARALLVHPPQTVHVLTAIYWQALRLWMKRAPFHPHPA